MKNIFTFSSYFEFLNEFFLSQGARSGKKSSFSKHAGIQTAYLSQVLKRKVDLNLEQAQLACEYFEMSDKESHYFMLLVQKERAGTKALREYFQKQIDAEVQKNHNIKNRLDFAGELSASDQVEYYSKWHYLAIHVLVSIKDFQTKESIREYLNIGIKELNSALEFLLRTNLIQQDNDRYIRGGGHIHLGKDSPNIIKHHTNWRLKAIEQLTRKTEKDVHYSVVYTLSKKDAEKLKERILKMIQENIKTIEPSPEEVAYVNVIDFFELKGLD